MSWFPRKAFCKARTRARTAGATRQRRRSPPGWRVSIDRETFLSATCRKAGLPANAWHDAETEIRVFEADVFGDESVRPD